MTTVMGSDVYRHGFPPRTNPRLTGMVALDSALAGSTRGGNDQGRRRPVRDRAALALDVVVTLSILAAATRIIELAMMESQLARTIGYAIVLLVAMILWLAWRREMQPPHERPQRLDAIAIAFTLVVTSLFAIGDQPHPMFLFVVALILLLRSYGLRAGVLVVVSMVVLQAVVFVVSGRGWQWIAQQAVGSSLLFGFGLIVAWLFAEIDQQSRANAALAVQVRIRAESAIELASLQERQRVARDLHDGIGHQVTVMMMSLQFAERMRDKDPDRAWAEVAEARSQAAKTLADIRLLARALHPSGVSDGGVADLAALASSFEGTGLAVRVSDDTAGADLDGELARFRQRFVQEALTNVIRHSSASRVEVSQRIHGSELALAVVDNGGRTAAVTPGFGLRSLAERAGALGGRTDVRASDTGLELAATIPLTGVALTTGALTTGAMP